MQTLVHNKYPCPVIGKEVQVEELYQLEGTCTCQIDIHLITWRCLDSSRCPNLAVCPLYREYAATGERSLWDR